MKGVDDRTEWLEADGLGGFASGTTSGIRTRRYHALLLSATTPPTGRMVLVNGFDAWIDTPAGSFALSSQRYAPDVRHPDGASRIASFSREPWPTWWFTCPDGTSVRHDVVSQHGTGTVLLTWRVTAGSADVTLRVRPFLSGRDYHSLHHENAAFRFEAERAGGATALRPYEGTPRIVMLSDGEYRHAPDWYRQFLYSAERERGLDDVEDLASPGELVWTLTADEPEAVLTLKAGGTGPLEHRSAADVRALAADIRNSERGRRSAFATQLDRAADAYIVSRGRGLTIVAGYPWFTDWGRDTFIAIRGLCLATGRHAVARDVLVEWAGAVSEGMLPNRFPDRGEAPEFNSVDASLWYVIAVHELLELARANVTLVSAPQRRILEDAVIAIVTGYAAGTRFGIRMERDGLLAAGVPGQQLTWMDARVGDHVITPRIGKPIEIQALWLNALSIASAIDPEWSEALATGKASLDARFWSDTRGYLADVVDVDHVKGDDDFTFRPNQILALGGLPMALIDGDRAQRVVDAVEARLLTPIGLRSLARQERGYALRYEGGPAERDGVYHQGTVWPWLMGAFVDAWVRARGNTPWAHAEARRRFVAPLLAHLDTAGLGHVSEIADAEAPFTPRGCPFQAWSLGELLRIDRAMLADAPEPDLQVHRART